MQKHVLLVHCYYSSISGLALIFILVYLDWHCSLYLSRLLGVLSLWSSMLVIAFMKHHCFLGLLALKWTHLVCFRNEVISCWRGITIAGTFSVEGKCYASNPEWLKRRVLYMTKYQENDHKFVKLEVWMCLLHMCISAPLVINQ